ncbi:hypothetical protein EV368DRAFT_90051 [Lentinula lateritia]|nr:hypothetical protein EV368DRAFT_90051 [Lentinula lateritia]
MQDQPWSAQDERQIRGRAHRQPQSKVVTVIHLLANDSSDIIMYNISRGKEHLFDAFLNRQLGQDLTDSLSGKLIIVDESEDSAIVAEEAEGSKTRKQAKGSKAKAKHAPQVEQSKPRKARGTNEALETNEGNSEVVEKRVSQNTNSNEEADPDDNPIYSEENRNRVGTAEQDEAIHSSSAQVDDTDASVAQSFIDETDSGWNSRVETDDADGDGFRDATSEAEIASNPQEAEDNLEYHDDDENFFAAAVATDSPGYDLPASNRKKSQRRKRATPQVVGAASSSVEENLSTTAVSPVPSTNYSSRITLLGEIAARTGSMPGTPPLKRKKAESHSDLDGIEISEVSPVLSKRHRRAETESPSRIPMKAKSRFIDLNALNASTRDPQSHLSSKPDVQAVPLPHPRASKSNRNTSQSSIPAPASARPQQKTSEVALKPEKNSFFTPAPIRPQQSNTFPRPRRAEDGNNGHAKNKVTRGIQEENRRGSYRSSSSIGLHESNAEAFSDKTSAPPPPRTAVPTSSRAHSFAPSSSRSDMYESNAKPSSRKIAASSSARTAVVTSTRGHSLAPSSSRTFIHESNAEASSSKIAAPSSVRTAGATSSRNNSFAALNRSIFTTPANSRAPKHPRIEDESDEEDHSPPRHITQTKKSWARK